MPHIAPQVHEISVGELRNVSVDFTGTLDGSEILTGTPTVVEVGTAALTLGSKAVNSATVEILDTSVTAGLAVQFTVDASSAVLGTTYLIDITCGTDASQTVKGRVTLVCE